MLREKSTRLQYYLQLRDNLLHYNQSVSEEKCFLLAGLALQADFGNFNEQRHVGAYFDPREFFPAWVSHLCEFDLQKASMVKRKIVRSFVLFGDFESRMCILFLLALH